MINRIGKENSLAPNQIEALIKEPKPIGIIQDLPKESKLELIIDTFFKSIEHSLKEKKSIIEDLIVAAHNNAKAKLKTKTNEEISKATGGFGIPGFKWPL